MKRILIHITLSLMMVLATYTSKAQSEYQNEIKTTNATVVNKDGTTIVDINMGLDDLNINKNHLIVVTPIISAINGSESIHLSPMIIKGSLRNKILKRPFEWKGKPSFDTKDTYMVVRKNNTHQSINYNENTPQEEWHQDARLWLKTEVIGCADCDLEESSIDLMDRIFTIYSPVYTMSFVTPEIEQVKQRSEKHTAYLNYHQGKYELLRNYKDNAEKLDEVESVINEVKTHKDLTLTNIQINGYASPEGAFDSNMTLSKNRANSFANYIMQKYSLNSDQMSINWHGEDWDGLKESLATSTITNKDDVFKIIDTEPNHDARDAKIIALDNGQTYNNILNNLYPPLRRNDYTIGLIARAFDVEEAKEIIKTRPNILSLNEMFLVAQTYTKGSKEYNEVFDVAARVFPNDPVSNINVAAKDIENGNYDVAIERLNKIKGNADALNNLGIALVHKGDYEEAMKAFVAAKNEGLDIAGTNADELDKFLKSR